MPITQDYLILNTNSNDKYKKINTIMIPISEEEELKLDKGKSFKVERGNQIFNIEQRNIYCYGEVDFSTGSSDLEQISTFNFLDYLDNSEGLRIYSDYNYEDHTCVSPINRCRVTETWNPARIAQFAHGSLGKPKRILLFRRIKNLC